MIDTADTVRHQQTGEIFTVACVHGDYVHTIGWPEKSIRLADLTLVESATDTARQAMIEDLARSTGMGHRPRCARERLKIGSVSAQEGLGSFAGCRWLGW